MVVLHGKGVFNDVAIGKLFFLNKEVKEIRRYKVTETGQEVQRYQEAKAKAVEQLKALYDKAVREVGEGNAAIFEVHQMMLDDDDYTASIVNIIESQKLNAEYAVSVTADNFATMFADMDDEYMKERAADVRDISDRVIRILDDGGSGEAEITEPVIIVAEDLAPSETVQLDKSNILAFVTAKGSLNSHTAILARTMNIPAIVGLGVSLMDKSLNGKEAIVDGKSGELYIEPEAGIIAEKKARKEEIEKYRELLQTMKGQETVTLDGKKIKLYANIGSVTDVASVLQNDAGGIGLFRSEFLYLEKNDYPTEQEQFQAYKTVAENMAGKKVIIRTLDIGADKQVDYFKMDQEENPAMGYRAIRICLDRVEIFKTQLRALYRASAFGNIAIMYPMIVSLKEIKRVKEIAQEVKKELEEKGIPYGEVEQGIMIETPAASIISDLLAKEVDFFSIGTNDLTQYTLAIDRQNDKLDYHYDAHHEAILRQIKMVVDNAHEAGIWAGICGELGADMELTEQLIKMGVDELSVTPSFILPIRKIIRETSVK